MNASVNQFVVGPTRPQDGRTETPSSAQAEHNKRVEGVQDVMRFYSQTGAFYPVAQPM